MQVDVFERCILLVYFIPREKHVSSERLLEIANKWLQNDACYVVYREGKFLTIDTMYDGLLSYLVAGRGRGQGEGISPGAWAHGPDAGVLEAA
jgi:hypothetical protein